MANKYKAGTLILLSPFSNLLSLLSDYPIFRLFKCFSIYRFPIDENISELTTTNLILLHGGKDKTIHPRHSEILESKHKGTGTVSRGVITSASHNNLLYLGWEQLRELTKNEI